MDRPRGGSTRASRAHHGIRSDRFVENRYRNKEIQRIQRSVRRRNSSGYTTTKFTFNFVGFLALLFFIPGFVLAIVAAAKSEGKKALSIVSAVFLILSGILMFLLLPVARIYAVGDTKLYKLDAEIFSETVKKASGSVLYGVVALLSGVASIVSAVFNKN